MTNSWTKQDNPHDLYPKRGHYLPDAPLDCIQDRHDIFTIQKSNSIMKSHSSGVWLHQYPPCTVSWFFAFGLFVCDHRPSFLRNIEHLHLHWLQPSHAGVLSYRVVWVRRFLPLLKFVSLRDSMFWFWVPSCVGYSIYFSKPNESIPFDFLWEVAVMKVRSTCVDAL